MSAQAPRWLSSVRGRRFANPEVIGKGAGGTVYRTFDHERNAVVAVKGLREPNPDAVAGLKREFRALNRLLHPNLLQLHELLYWDGEWLLTMECIDGENFLEWVRPGYRAHHDASRDTGGSADSDPTPTGSGSSPLSIDTGVLDEGRLRDALGQLVLGLDVVHRSARLHRDIKPSNVLVTRGGRVVVCDFGLVTEMQAAAGGSAIVGTPAYMSPEQAAGAPLGAASDLYAVGVMLYEALAGLRPFAGESDEIMQRKQRVIPVPPSQLAGRPLPADLEQLAMRLLAIDPGARPTASEVRAALGETLGPAPLVADPPLEGRDASLATMRSALDGVRRSGRGHTLLVQGAAGIGKSALLRHFADELLASEVANVLTGSCYEREFVPHRALDEVMDAFATHLRSFEEEVARALDPEEVAPLLVLFPMLARVPALSREPGARTSSPSTLDPRELRRGALGALRRLFDATSQGKPWVVIVDDLQWGDEESLPILSALLGHPAAGPMLFVGALHHSRTSDDVPILQVMTRRPEAFGGVTLVELGPLPAEDAIRVARAWLGGDTGARELAARSGGVPGTLRSLAHGVLSESRTASVEGEATEVDMLEARLARLSDDARGLLTAVALATHRETLGVLDRALGGLSDLTRALAILQRRDLVKAIPVGEHLRIEVTDDRIRATLRARMAPEERVKMHQALHEAVSAERPADYETLLFHARAAGMHSLAAKHALAAANGARASLRFERAARFAQMAVQLLPHDEVTFDVRRKLAEALGLAGRGAEAGRAFVRAADSAPTESLAHECRRIGAGHLLRSGYLEEGETAMNAQLTLLGAESLDAPDSLVARVVAAATERSRRVLREGLPLVAGGVESPLPELIDTHWEAVTGLALIDPTRAGWLQLRHQRYARRLGEPKRLARSLWAEAFMTGLRGRSAQRDVEALLVRAVGLTPGDAESQARAAVLQPLVRGVLSAAAGEYPMARGQLARALRIAREKGPAQAWEVAVAETYMLWAMAQLGELRTMSTRIQALLSDVEPRADRFFETTLTTGSCALAKLAEGDAEEVVRRAERARSVWDRATAPLPCALSDVATVYAELYRGDAERAERAAAALPGGDGARTRLGIQHLDVEFMVARALSSLATARMGRAAIRSRQALASVDKTAAAIRSHVAPTHHVLARLLDGLALIERRHETEAMVALHEAEAELRRRGMATIATVTRAAHGVALGGDAGATFLDQARHDLRAFGVRHPDAFLGIWIGPPRPEP
ncbi:MAG: AAA family ATPase [Sandaracinaceae bacterium]|nr:AAA family ATPase [Sandaracinaceae bacterium]